MVSYKNAVSASARHTKVLILVVMEDGLVQSVTLHKRTAISVLILVVMEDGLVLLSKLLSKLVVKSVLILVVMEDGLVLVFK